MVSPARRHFQRRMAAREASAETSQHVRGGAFEILSASLLEDRRRLKDLQSLERKIEAKREMLPKYEAYVEGVLESGAGVQDDLLMHVLVWRFDIGDLAGGLRIAEYAIEHNLQPPDHYARSTPAIVAEEVATEALRQLGTQEAAEGRTEVARELLPSLGQAAAITADADMHDQIRAKLHKALGYAHRVIGEQEAAAEHFQEALEHLRRAVELDDRVGVKKDIERLERAIKEHEQQQ